MQDRAAGERGNHLAGRPDVDEHRTRLNDASERRLVGRTHLGTDQVVGIVLQARHEESELTIAPRRRPPGELRDRRAMGARRLRERREADVERMDAGAKDAGCPLGRAHGRSAPTVSGAGHEHRDAGGGGVAGGQPRAGGVEPGLLIA